MFACIWGAYNLQPDYKVVDAKMRPIDKTEDATSKYTKEASKKFLTPDETPMSAPSLSGPAEEEEEDMFDSME